MKNNKGFSLVELIVVIAIMAILAAVAVVGFSVYIPKAQKAADEQLVSDISDALNLYMYSDPISDYPVGKLVINQDGVRFYGTDGAETPLAGTDVEKALIASFGSDYQNKLKLKYDSWTASSTLINGMVASEAGIVKDSSYLSGNRADQLLQDVEKFTDMAANLSEAMTGKQNGTTLAGLYGQNLLDETAKKYGISVTDDKYMKADGSGKVDWDKWSVDHPQEFSNMLVLAASVDFQQEKADQDNHEFSGATMLINSFSTYYSFAATCPEFSSVLDQYLDAMNIGNKSEEIVVDGVTQTRYYTEIKSPVDNQISKIYTVNSSTDGINWYNALNAELNKGYKNGDGKTFAQYTQKGENGALSDAQQDNLAFGAILSSLGNVSAEDIAGDLNNANLFTEGAVKDKYEQYLGAVETMYGYNGDFHVADGEIAILYNQNLHVVIDSISQ